MSRIDKKRASQGDIPAVTAQKEPRSKVTSVPSNSRAAISHSSTPEPAKHVIRQRAYELYEKRGRETAMRGDWLHAERRSWVQFQRARVG